MIGGLSANVSAHGGAHDWSERVLGFQLQVVLCAEELGPRNSLLELRRTIVKVEDVLNLADVIATVLAARGWKIQAVRFDDEVAVILGRDATAGEVEADLASLPEDVRAAIGGPVRVCATLDDRVLELELGSDGLRGVYDAPRLRVAQIS